MAERTHSVRLRLVVDQLRRDASEAARSIGGIGSAAVDAGKQSGALAALGGAARGVGQTLAAVGTVAAGSMVALGAATIATGISYNTLEQSTRAALTTLLGSAEAATAQMDKLREFVRTALFPREVFIQGQQQLLAFGFAAESVIPTLDAVQNAVAATGGSAQVFTEVVEILAEMQSTGEITAGTLNELGRRGINAAALIGAAMGKTENEIRESITSGAIDGREAIDLLVNAMETRFAGAAALISNTWTGARGLVTAALRDIGSATVEAFIDPRGGGAAVVWAQNLAEVLYALERQIRDVVAVFRGSADPTFRRWGDLLLDLAQRIDEFDVGALLDSLREGAPALAALGAAAAAAGGQVTLAAVGMGGLAGAISPLGAAITAAVVASPELRQVLMDLLVALQPLLPVILDTGVALATGLTTGLTVIAELLTPLVGLVEALVEVFTALPAPIQGATVGVAGFALALRFGGSVGTAIAVLTTLGLIFESFGDQTEQARTNLPGLTEDLERLVETGEATAGLSQLFGEGAAGVERFADALDSASEGAFTFENWNRTFDEIERNKQVFRDLDAAMAAAVEQGLDADEVFQAVAETYGLNADQIEKLQERLPNFIAESERQAEATGAAGGATDDLTGAQGDLVTATSEATAAMREQADALRAATDPIFALFEALSDVEEAQSAYNTAVEDFGAKSPEAEAAAIGLLEATVGLQGAAGDATGAFNGKLTPAMRTALEAAGATEGEIDAVEAALKDAREQLDKYEGRYEARVELEGAAAAEAAAKRIQRHLANIDRTVTISFKTRGFAPVGSIRIPTQRWGGVTMHAQQGLLREAATFSPKAPAHFAFAEPATGGEAFIPMRGNRDRSLGILSTAAGWYDAAVVPNEAAKPGYVLTEDGSWVPRNFFAATAIAKVTMPKPGFVQAEDGSWVPKSFYDTTKRNPAENASRTGPRGPRTWDFYTSGGRSYARIFATGELVALGKMHEDEAFAHLKKVGKLGHGGGVFGEPGPDQVPAWLTRGEHVWTAREVQAAGGHQAVEALRAAVLGQASRFAVGGPVGVPRMQSGGAVAGNAALPDHFTASAVIDLGEGFQQRVAVEFERHDLDLDRMVTQGTGAAR